MTKRAKPVAREQESESDRKRERERRKVLYSTGFVVAVAIRVERTSFPNPRTQHFNNPRTPSGASPDKDAAQLDPFLPRARC